MEKNITFKFTEKNFANPNQMQALTLAYIGDSIFGHNLADAKFNVDFGRKSITGVLNSEAEYLYPRVSLKGTISGASFSGDENGVSMRGNFFGPKAAELGGVFRVDYNDGSGTYGSFGAKKQ